MHLYFNVRVYSIAIKIVRSYLLGGLHLFTRFSVVKLTSHGLQFVFILSATSKHYILLSSLALLFLLSPSVCIFTAQSISFL